MYTNHYNNIQCLNWVKIGMRTLKELKKCTFLKIETFCEINESFATFSPPYIWDCNKLLNTTNKY